ncbi:MAG: MFS transporter [Gaiellaceae bacterium]|nr:MAG: MFS transporter [Gaiellaceae bacterium]
MRERRRERWLTRGVGSVGAASALSDLGHEVPTSLLPAFLTSTLGAPAAALGVIEGIADGLAGAAKLVGGAPADDPERRRRTVVGGYATTAVLSSAIGLATSAWQVGVLRTGAWVARGLRTPSRNALLADLVHPSAYGRAYGFERTMDNLGAIGGPLLALGLVAAVGVRSAILLSIVPGLLAVGAILLAVREAPRGGRRAHEPFRVRVRPVLRGRLGQLFVAVGAFEVGNVAATLLVLRATELLTPGRGEDSAVQIAIALYVAYNVAATLASLPGGHWLDRTGPLRVLGAGVAAFALAYAGFAVAGADVVLLGVLFVLAGVGIGLVETSESAAVASLAPVELRGSAFGLLGAAQSFGNLAASALAGALWTLVSPEAAFAYLTLWMLVALAGLALARR